jgi:hypothetical protein
VPDQGDYYRAPFQPSQRFQVIPRYSSLFQHIFLKAGAGTSVSLDRPCEAMLSNPAAQVERNCPLAAFSSFYHPWGLKVSDHKWIYVE